MRRLFSWLLLLALLAPVRAFCGEGKTVYVIAVREEITHNTLFLVRRGIREAQAHHAEALILDMETNGGRVDVTEEIIKLLEHCPFKTYTYVNPKAFSAGAYIAAATDEIYMAPGGVIGAATPLMLNPGGEGVATLPKAIEEKMTSAMRGLIRATAQQKGHNPDVFEAMVDADLGLTIDGTVIVPKGKLLTLTSAEAARKYGKPAKPLLSAGTVSTLDELLSSVGLANAKIVTVKPYGFEIAARWLTAFSPLLIIIGLIAVYLEFKAPGLGVPTVVAIGAFGLYFLSYFVAGLVGWEEVALFVVGFAFLGFELLFPGHLLSGILGTLLIITALVLGMTEKWPGGSLMPSWGDLQLPLVKVLGSFVCSVVTMIILGKFLPETNLFHRLELRAATNSTEGYTTARVESAAVVDAVGVADTRLRPSGKARFGDDVVDVVTEGEMIDKGTSIKIIEVQGSRVVVKRIS